MGESLSSQRIQRVITGVCQSLERDSTIQVRLNTQEFADEHAQLLATAIARNTSMKKFDLKGPCEKLTDMGISALVHALGTHPAVNRVTLDQVHIGHRASLAISQMIEQSRTLETICFEKNSIISGWESIINAAFGPDSRLRVMSFSRNELTTQHACLMASAVRLNRNCHLQCLVLSDNNIGNEGIQELAKALAGIESLKMIALNDNNVNEQALSSLEEIASSNPQIKRIYLYGNPFPRGSPYWTRITYFLLLNEAGRAEMRDESCRKLYPQILARVSSSPRILYGLLTDLPHLWCPRET